MFENRIKGSESPTVTPPRRFGSRASSNRSSLVGSRNHSDSDGEADDILANNERPDISELMRQFETPERQDSKKAVEIQITESTSDTDVSQASWDIVFCLLKWKYLPLVTLWREPVVYLALFSGSKKVKPLW